MEEKETPEGEFHHFQLVDPDGFVPMSISVLVHYNPRAARNESAADDPISADDIIALHDALQTFDGNYLAALSKK